MRSRILAALIPVALIILLVISTVVGVDTYINQRTTVAQAQATATAQAITSNPYPSYLPGKSTLAFVDPLNQASGSQWSSGTNATGGACRFNGGAYHVSQQPNGYYMDCRVSGTFSNLAFEVQLAITQGDCGGITFREGSNGQLYKFDVCQNGTYRVIKYTGYSRSDAHTLRKGSSLAVNTGLNKVAIVANGSTMTFYVNSQQIDQVQDSSYTSGLIGLIADPGYNHTTDVAYTNARLWTL